MFMTIFKKLTGFDPAAVLIGIFLLIIAAVMIPNYTKVLGFFGYDTRAVLKDKLDQANTNVQVAVGVNDANKETVKGLQSSVKNTEDVIVSKVKADEATQKNTTVIKERVTMRVKKILATPGKTEEQKAKEISTVHITSLWDSYCSFNNDSQCKDNVSKDT